jgi:hypothetical protein
MMTLQNLDRDVPAQDAAIEQMEQYIAGGFRHLWISHSKLFADGKTTSTASGTSGTRLDVTSANLTVFPNNIFNYS